MTPRKPKRGGARKGAGRKPGRKYVAVTVLLRPDQVERIRDFRDAYGHSFNSFVRGAIDAVVARPKASE